MYKRLFGGGLKNPTSSDLDYLAEHGWGVELSQTNLISASNQAELILENWTPYIDNGIPIWADISNMCASGPGFGLNYYSSTADIDAKFHPGFQKCIDAGMAGVSWEGGWDNVVKWLLAYKPSDCKLCQMVVTTYFTAGPAAPNQSPTGTYIPTNPENTREWRMGVVDDVTYEIYWPTGTFSPTNMIWMGQWLKDNSLGSMPFGFVTTWSGESLNWWGTGSGLIPIPQQKATAATAIQSVLPGLEMAEFGVIGCMAEYAHTYGLTYESYARWCDTLFDSAGVTTDDATAPSNTNQSVPVQLGWDN